MIYLILFNNFRCILIILQNNFNDILLKTAHLFWKEIFGFSFWQKETEGEIVSQYVIFVEGLSFAVIL